MPFAESLANQFYVSKATVLNDVNDLEMFWNETGITCTRKVRYGIKAEGNESQMRRALFSAQKKIIEYSSEKTADKLQILYPDIDLRSLEEIIHETEKQFNFVLTDVSSKEFLIQIGIILLRIKMNCRIEESPLPIEYDRERKEWFACQFLREQIILNMDCEIPDIEMREILKSLKGLRYQVPIAGIKKRSDMEAEASEMFDYMLDVLKKVDSKYSLRLAQDDDLLFFLFNHLEAMVHRIQSKMYLENPSLESVKNEMSYEYEIASYIIGKFNKKYTIETTDDEIAYVTFHVGASMERTIQKNKKEYMVTIVCMAGMGTSQFISVKLKRLFPNLVVKQIISESMAKRLKREDQDFVITTIPLTLEGIDVIRVSVVLNEQDIKKIQKYVNRMDETEDRENDIYSCLKEFLHDNISILKCDLRSREEAIVLLGNRMIREGYADDGFVESIFEREKISDTYMSGFIAIPHAFEEHILKQGIGILTLKNPINWGEGQVRIIFMLALDMKTENEKIQKIFKAIYNLTRTPRDVEKMLRAEDLKSLKKNLI